MTYSCTIYYESPSVWKVYNVSKSLQKKDVPEMMQCIQKRVKNSFQNKEISTTSLHIVKDNPNLGKEIPSAPEDKIISLAECKKLLEGHGDVYSMEDVIKIRRILCRLCQLEYQLYKENKALENGQRNSVHKSIYRRASS